MIVEISDPDGVIGIEIELPDSGSTVPLVDGFGYVHPGSVHVGYVEPPIRLCTAAEECRNTGEVVVTLHHSRAF